ncbi:MAG: DUF2088 domain-containing protein [Planctomycetota bacterium]|nr:MAG: DUF2088 domain-containing protein [Planctomycetota bacterium]
MHPVASRRRSPSWFSAVSCKAILGEFYSMTTTLRFGTDSEVLLDLPPERLVASCGQPDCEPVDDLSAAVAAGLISPLDFPPLTQCVLPDDRVAIVLDPELPAWEDLLAGAISGLLEARVAAENLTIVVGGEVEHDSLAARVREVTDDTITVVRHNSEERSELAFLGTTTEGKGVYLNRTIVDAEFVLPIGCLRLDSMAGYHGVHGVLYPTFADEETRQRFRAPSNEEWAAHRRRRREETEQAARLLGVLLTIQVVPGGSGEVLQVLVGAPEAVARKGREICEAVWHQEVPRRAELVVAAIEGDSSCQTWSNVTRALAAANGAVTDDGAIAICTELASPPGPALRRLVEARDYEATLLALQKDRSTDAAAATLLLHLLSVRQVYFVSQLDEETVEDLGMAPVRSVAELTRLITRSESCLLIANAQHAIATPAGEMAAPSHVARQ